MRKILAFIMAAMLMSTGLTALADSSASEPQAVCETLATETTASETQTADEAPSDEVSAPEALDMMAVAEQNVFEFDFIKWYSTPDEAMTAFGLNADNCVTANTDDDHMTIDFDYPSAQDGNSTRVRLSFERIGDALALTDISQSEVLADLQAVSAYADAMATRAEEMFNAETIRKTVYNTFKAVNGMVEQLNAKPNATTMKSSSFSAYFTGADDVKRQIYFSMQIGPAASSEILTDVQEGYCATYAYNIKYDPMMAIFG